MKANITSFLALPKQDGLKDQGPRQIISAKRHRKLVNNVSVRNRYSSSDDDSFTNANMVELIVDAHTPQLKPRAKLLERHIGRLPGSAPEPAGRARGKSRAGLTAESGEKARGTRAMQQTPREQNTSVGISTMPPPLGFECIDLTPNALEEVRDQPLSLPLLPETLGGMPRQFGALIPGHQLNHLSGVHGATSSDSEEDRDEEDPYEYGSGKEFLGSSDSDEDAEREPSIQIDRSVLPINEVESSSSSIEELEWEVEAIVKHRQLRGKMEFQIKWKGFPDSANTWEPLAHVNDCVFLQPYLEKHQLSVNFTSPTKRRRR